MFKKKLVMGIPDSENAQNLFDNARMLIEMKSFWNLTLRVLAHAGTVPCGLEEPEILLTTPSKHSYVSRGSHVRHFDVILPWVLTVKRSLIWALLLEYGLRLALFREKSAPR